MIKKHVMVGALMALSSTAAGASDVSPEDMVIKLFDAMRAGNGGAIREMVVADARLDRLKPDGTLQQGTFERWISWVDTQEDGDADEQVFGVKTLSASPELATVWAPFELTYKGKFVGCGINQFTLAKSKDGWKFLYGIDMHHDGDCAEFKKEIMK
ncbi:hypothetical protein [Kordiimonas laminariae]|uniref:hypothetical protein n=1 Tax=Kordiimonas laminariae TaxID=2917717 RepID=UPI001FF2D322|nr:hypothetical protein [Kordiimonas laminariae]MCK0070672.1 hypothetical protein [Kordiimonas laminariae]